MFLFETCSIVHPYLSGWLCWLERNGWFGSCRKNARRRQFRSILHSGNFDNARSLFNGLLTKTPSHRYFSLLPMSGEKVLTWVSTYRLSRTHSGTRVLLVLLVFHQDQPKSSLPPPDAYPHSAIIPIFPAATTSSEPRACRNARRAPRGSVAALQELDVVVTCQGGDYTNEVHPKLRAAGWTGAAPLRRRRRRRALQGRPPSLLSLAVAANARGAPCPSAPPSLPSAPALAFFGSLALPRWPSFSRA